MEAKEQAMLVRIHGRVQGVSFRVWTRMEAEKLGLGGWVRNEDDGTVRALIAGPEPAISKMLERFWQGPPGASVANVTFENVDVSEGTGTFRITTS
ncbi:MULTISPECIES: acylphosphatase [Phyllobacterium]|jgi:acylphosphatase|uniref:Acylphosphatase n=1 Tax=Phyllobacterium sophorae TaxID=1520277 RepID=A0A2P7B422_9HYPH|nr:MULTISPECIES: acylphosphatase [Phyllobacterium]PSH61234.1 acylphosphatase [Phyllobacterium sophorae]UXN63283.1 acylphosphatase [Phyllobacterium sp. A18/5-2]